MAWTNKKTIENIIKTCVFIAIANLPFITVTSQIGIDTFIDSFENPQYYQCLKNTIIKEKSNTEETGKYLLVQRPSHPQFTLTENDIIIYHNDEEEIHCDKISYINHITSLKKYYTDSYHTTTPIYEQQIIGKVIGSIDDNIWNTLSIKIWDATIKNLNINALFTNH